MMRELTETGCSLVFITHKLDEALAVADQITVLRDGKAIDTVAADETSEQELARMMVGREVLFDRESRETVPGEPVLEVNGVRVDGDRGLEQVSGVDLAVREGEILGIAGVQGNGQNELIEGIAGLRPVTAGTIRFDDKKITDLSRRHRIESGIAYIPEDRQTEGLVQDYDLVRNALLGNQTISPYVSSGIIDWSAVHDHAETIIDEYDVQAQNANSEAISLSGGNQQKFIVGREIMRDPDVMIASHPTRGVDIGSIEFIHNRLLELRDAGLAVVVVSSKLEEIQRLSDRIAVMYEGEFIDVVDPDKVTEEELGLLMAGRSRDESGEEDEEMHITEANKDMTTKGTEKGDDTDTTVTDSRDGGV
ncbi:ABC transporter ATP-binding protein [Haladaptatus pallidirubidus]